MKMRVKSALDSCVYFESVKSGLALYQVTPFKATECKKFFSTRNLRPVNRNDTIFYEFNYFLIRIAKFRQYLSCEWGSSPPLPLGDFFY